MGIYRRLVVRLRTDFAYTCLILLLAVPAFAGNGNRNDIVGDSLGSRAVLFANLTVACPGSGGQPGSCVPQVNGTRVYCSDCQQTTPCLGGGSGAQANYLNGAWQCGGLLSPALAFPTCTSPSGTSNYTIATSAVFPITECINWVLGANVALAYTTSTPPAGRVGWTFRAYVRQPASGGPYTLTLSGTSPGFTLTSGCPSLPSMPTGANHGLDLVMVLDPITLKLNVEACNTTGN